MLLYFYSLGCYISPTAALKKVKARRDYNIFRKGIPLDSGYGKKGIFVVLNPFLV